MRKKHYDQTIQRFGMGRNTFRAANKRLKKFRKANAYGLLLLGGSLIGLGAAMAINSNTGAGPSDVLLTGLANTFNLPLAVIGYCWVAFIYSVIIVIRGNLRIATFVMSITIATTLPAFVEIMPEADNYAGGLLYCAVGILAMGFGVVIGASGGLGRGSYEVIAERISQLTGTKERNARLAFENTTLIAGIALGGEFGAGTVMLAMTIGPLIDILTEGYAAALDARRVKSVG